MNRRSGEWRAAVAAGVEVVTGLVLIVRTSVFGELLQRLTALLMRG
jgi:hypothetical protein